MTVGICGKNQSHVTHCLGVKKLIQNVILVLNGNNLLLIQIVAPSALIVAHLALMVAATALITTLQHFFSSIMDTKSLLKKTLVDQGALKGHPRSLLTAAVQ